MDPFTTYVAAAVAKSNCLKAHNGVRDKAGAPPRQSFTHSLFQVVDNEVPKSCWDGFPNVLNVICNRHLVKPTRTMGEEWARWEWERAPMRLMRITVVRCWRRRRWRRGRCRFAPLMIAIGSGWHRLRWWWGHDRRRWHRLRWTRILRGGCASAQNRDPTCRVTRPATVVLVGDRGVEGPDAPHLGRHPMLAMYLTNLAAHNAEIGGRRTLREGRVDPTTRTALPARVVESHNRGTILDNVVDLRPHPTSRVDWALDTTEVAGKERHGYGKGHRVGITPSSRRVGMQCENETSSVRDAAAAYKTPQHAANSDGGLDPGN